MLTGDDMKELIKRFFTSEDKQNISEITQMEFDNILSTIPEQVWSAAHSADKHIVSRYDEVGLHIIRCILAQRIYEHRVAKYIKPSYKEYDQFMEEGYVTISDFDKQRDAEKFNALMEVITLGTHTKTNWNTRVDVGGEYDIQHTLHIDTFHPAFKAFTYNNAVTPDEGPFAFVPGTHKNSLGKLKLLYNTSNNRTKAILDEKLERSQDHERWTESFRLDLGTTNCIDDDSINSKLASYNLPAEELVLGDANTLIIADTSGLHRKYPAKTGHKRETGRFVLPRLNPFKID